MAHCGHHVPQPFHVYDDETKFTLFYFTKQWLARNFDILERVCEMVENILNLLTVIIRRIWDESIVVKASEREGSNIFLFILEMKSLITLSSFIDTWRDWGELKKMQWMRRSLLMKRRKWRKKWMIKIKMKKSQRGYYDDYWWHNIWPPN